MRDTLHPEMVGGNVVAHLEEMSRLKDDLFGHFYWGDSLVWKAIQEHILKADDCVLIERPKRLFSHRGTGPISFKSAHIWSKPMKDNRLLPRDVFSIKFTVAHADNEDYSAYMENPAHKSFEIFVPLDLEVNFTKAKFDKWVEEHRIERDEKIRTGELAELERLQTKYKKKRKR